MMGDGLLVSDLSQRFEDGLSARAILSCIRRHLAMVLAFTLSLCIAGALVGLGLPAWFKAEGVVVIHSRPQRMADLQELPDPTPDLNVIQSEVDILQSRSVIEPVVRSLRLWEAPEFQKMEYPQGWSWQTVEERLRETRQDLWEILGGSEDSSREQPPVSTQPSDANRTNDASQPTQEQIDAAVETYTGYLLVQTDGHSMTIRVTYRAWTPERAAAVVNAHIDSYRNVEVKAKVTAAGRANSALTAQVAELRQQLQEAEMAVTRYREEHHLTGAARDSAGVSAQLAGLNNQLIIARADLAESEARASRIGSGGDSLPEVVASGTISGLRGHEAQLVAREADLSNYHGEEYPELRRVRASLQQVREQISREIKRDRSAALQTLERSRTREKSLQQSITELTKQLNSADAGLQQLQGKADSIRSLLLTFEKRVGETAANPAFITPHSTVASRANASAASTSSKTKVLALVGGFVGLTLGSLLALLREFRDKGFRTSAQVQQQIGSLTVSATPRAIGRQRKSPADIILKDNRSAFAEAFRVSWANMQLAAERPRVGSFGGRRLGIAFGITSASSGEGKSTHALALARTAALAGESVVLVDADLRRSGVSRLLEQEFCFTLRDFLSDQCTANDVIVIEKRSGVHFVPSAPADAAWTSQDLQRFFNFVDYLKDRFAVVIIDLPPVLGLAETIRLAMAADSTVLVIRWGRTERQFVQFALDALRTASVPTTAVILNDVDLKAQRRRGYRDSTVAYTDKGLYRAASGYREPAATRAPLPVPAAKSYADSEIRRSEPQRNGTPRDQPRAAGSDIERLYNRYND
jgi:succinoglycan biosynthesis transport protein ExoP